MGSNRTNKSVDRIPDLLLQLYFCALNSFLVGVNEFALQNESKCTSKIEFYF